METYALISILAFFIGVIWLALLADIIATHSRRKKACHKGNGHLRQTSRANDRSIYPRSVKYKRARQKAISYQFNFITKPYPQELLQPA